MKRTAPGKILTTGMDARPGKTRPRFGGVFLCAGFPGQLAKARTAAMAISRGPIHLK